MEVMALHSKLKKQFLTEKAKKKKEWKPKARQYVTFNIP